MAVQYEIGEELDDLQVTWLDPDGNVRNFSTGWTFELKIGQTGSAAVMTKTTGITGSATAPNLVVTFAAEELVMAAATYTAQLRARRTIDSKDLFQQFEMAIRPVVT